MDESLLRIIALKSLGQISFIKYVGLSLTIAKSDLNVHQLAHIKTNNKSTKAHPGFLIHNIDPLFSGFTRNINILENITIFFLKMKVMMNWSLCESTELGSILLFAKLNCLFSLASLSTTATQGSCPLGEESKLALLSNFYTTSIA